MHVLAIWWWRSKIAYGGENGGEHLVCVSDFFSASSVSGP
jgi:hypothetical protein